MDPPAQLNKDDSSDFEMVESDASPDTVKKASAGHSCPALQGLTLKTMKERMPPAVRKLVYFENPIHSGVAIALILATLVLFTFDFGVPVHYIFCYFGKYLLLVNIAVHLVSLAGQRFLKWEGDLLKTHVAPRLDLVRGEIAQYLPSVDQATKFANSALSHIPGTIACFQRLFLVESLASTVKAFVLLYVAQVIGGLFSVCTLVWLGFVAAFTVPFFYDKHHDKVDPVIDQVYGQVSNTIELVKSKLPASLVGKPKSS